MSVYTVYSGPASVVVTQGGANYPMQAEGENGQVKLVVTESMAIRSSATSGVLRRTLNGKMCKLTITPFDSWSLLPVLFPTYIGAQTGGATSSDLKIGTRPHDFASGSTNGNAPSKIWTPDIGRMYTMARSALTKPPNMKLGVGQPLFEGVEISGLDVVDPALRSASSMIAIVESGASNPDTAGFSPDFINGHWLATWGTVAGFAAMEVEDFWTLSSAVKYSTLNIQGWPTHMKLDTVEFFIKGRLAGPTHTAIMTQIGTHAQGATLTEATPQDLVLTGPAGTSGGSAKTLTLKDCELVLENEAFEFGGTKLGTGSIGFYTKLDFSAGAPGPSLIFSA